MRTVGRGRWNWGIAAALVFILLTTLLPAQTRAVTETCRGCGGPWAVGMVLNVLLFVPLGFALAGRIRPALALLLPVLLSATIEWVQVFIPGRFSSWVDLATNAAGGVLGVLLWRLTRARTRGRPEPLLAVLLALWIGLVAFAELAWSPITGPTPAHVTLARGPVCFASPGVTCPRVLPPGTSRVVGEPSVRPGSVIRFDLTASRDTTVLLGLDASDGRELLKLYREGPDIIFRTPLEAKDLGFLQPSLRMFDALPMSGPTRLVGTVTLTRDAWDVALGRPRVTEAKPRWDLTYAWDLVLPGRPFASPAASAAIRWLTVVLLALPIGMLTGSSRWPAGLTFGAVALTQITLILVPLAFATPMETAPAFLGTAGGLLVGALLAQRLRRRARPGSGQEQPDDGLPLGPGQAGVGG